jgi:DNA polymerase-3 subunit epsilon
MDFIALDVETANEDLSSICSIGMVHFKGGMPFKTFSTLIDPEDHFSGFNIDIHGITPEDVAGKPTMKEALPLIATTLSGLIVVHHTPFDRVAFIRAAQRYQLTVSAIEWLDTARVARRTWERFSRSGYGLANLASEFGIEFQHHIAAEDARAAGTVLLLAMQHTGMSLAEIAERASQPLSQYSPLEAIQGNPDGPLFGQAISFTGSLSISRSEAAKLAAAMGCNFVPRVTKETTILVVGDQDIRRLKGEEKSANHRKAEAYLSQGQEIRIMCESDFNAICQIR